MLTRLLSIIILMESFVFEYACGQTHRVAKVKSQAYKKKTPL